MVDVNLLQDARHTRNWKQQTNPIYHWWGVYEIKVVVWDQVWGAPFHCSRRGV